MEIILMRHGKPVLPKSGWLAPFQMGRWIDDYNRSDVEPDNIPVASAQAASSASLIVASTASRALSSVHALGLRAAVSDKVFCEAQLPFSLWRFPYLPPQAWAVLFRVFWLLGYSRGADSFHATKTRAKAGAHQLITLAQDGPVLLVGHGMMNRLIAKELVAKGWVGQSRHESKCWSTSVYSYSVS